MNVVKGLAVVTLIVGSIMLAGALGAWLTRDSAAKPRCTHGASSIGPVTISGGKITGGSTTPHTEACLP